MTKKKSKILVLIFTILAVTFISYYPSLNNGFVNFDDDRYVYRNPMIRDLSWNGVGRIFTSVNYTVLYTPLVFLTYTFEYHFFKLRPFIYHLTNLVLHLLNCLLVFWFIFILGRKASVAFMVAILFGVHPLRVESVAWITERKDVLYALFFLGALICHIYYLRNRSSGYYYGVIVLFVLALLSKPAALVLPFILLLCDYFTNGRINKKDLSEKIPLFSIAAVFLILGMFTAAEYVREDPGFNFLDYIFVASYGLVFYLYKIVVPLNLSCLYPYPLKSGNLLPVAFLVSPLLIIILALVTAFSVRYTRKALFGGLFFLITIFSALQFFPTGRTIVADRYTYIPAIGIFFAVAELIVWLYRRKTRYIKVIVSAAFIVAVGALSILTWNRCKVWKSNLTLWGDAVSCCPDGYIPLAYVNRAVSYTDIGENGKAVSDFDRALIIYYKELGIDRDYTEVYDWILATGNGYPEIYKFLASKFAEIGKYAESKCCLIIYGRSRLNSGGFSEKDIPGIR